MKSSLALGILLLGVLLPLQAAAQSSHNEVAPPPVASAYASSARPPSGIGALVMGGVGIGLGTVNLATIPVCYADFYPSDVADLCMGLSVGVGVALLGVGIPSLIVGKLRRNRYKAWRKQRLEENGIHARMRLDELAVMPALGGGQLVMRGKF